MEFLQNWLDSSQLPALTAFLLGLMTAISPCPLATNITAVAFISRDISTKHKVFVSGLIYTLGRAISYTGLGLVFYFGASMFNIARFFQGWGEKILGPLLIIIGILMLDLIKIKFLSFQGLGEKVQSKMSGLKLAGPLLLGMVFALAFCPYSGVLYFGMLIPMTISSAQGLFLPLIFAIATGLPVIIVAWLISYTVSGVGNFYNKIKVFELWFRRIVAFVFVIVGIYYIFIMYFNS